MQKVTVWCAISASGIIGRFFFKDKAVTVNSLRSVEMIPNFLTPQLSGFPVYNHTLFQQDGAVALSQEFQ